MQSEWKQDNLDVLTKLSSLKRARNYKITDNYFSIDYVLNDNYISIGNGIEETNWSDK